MNADSLRIGVAGCAGTMGRLVVAEIVASDGCRLAGGSLRPGHPDAGADIAQRAGGPPTGVAATDDPEALFAACDAIIDFTVPEATVRHGALAARHGVILVAATTGLDGAQEQAMFEAAREAPIVRSSNISLGIAHMAETVTRLAGSLDDSYDIEVLAHVHRRKRDIPSGASMLLGRAAAQGRGVDLDGVSERVRDGDVAPRQPGAIGFATVRGGEGAGTHSVIFAGTHESLQITHRVYGRGLYATGAVRAALWARGKAPGLYDMGQVLGLDEPPRAATADT